MNLLTLMFTLAIIGACWYLINTFIPMPAPMKTVITVVVVLALCAVLLNITGLGDIQIGHIRN